MSAFGKWIQKIANNGAKVPNDLGLADAMQAEQKLYDHAEAIEAEEEAFSKDVTRIESLTQEVRRKTNPNVKLKRDSGILPAQG